MPVGLGLCARSAPEGAIPWIELPTSHVMDWGNRLAVTGACLIHSDGSTDSILGDHDERFPLNLLRFTLLAVKFRESLGTSFDT